MIFKNLSSDRRKTFFQQVSKTRTWMSFVVALVSFLYYPLCTIATVLRNLQARALYVNASASLEQELLNRMSAWLGFRSYAMYLSAILALCIALNGFRFLTSKKAMDLYGSLPYKKSQLFRTMYANGIYIYVIPWVVNMALAFLIAVLFGAWNQALILDVIYGFLTNFLVFLFVYSVSVLACTLTGRSLIAIVVALMLLFVEPVLEFILEGYISVFFHTYYGYKTETLVANGCNPLVRLAEAHYSVRWNAWVTDFTHVHTYMRALALPLGLCLLFTVLATILALLCFKTRRAEQAGEAVAFPVVRSIAKIVTTICVCLVVALLVMGSFVSYFSTFTTLMGIISILVAGVITSVLIEVVLDLNLRAGKQHLWQMGISIVISMAIFAVFRLDFFGYDTYLPDADEIESYAFFSETNSSLSDYYVGDDDQYNVNGSYWSVLEYYANHMYLTDVDSLLQVVKQSQEYMRENEQYYSNGTYEFTVLYRLKNGKEIYRTIYLDPEVDVTLMDQIMGSDAYHEGSYVFFKKDMVESAMSVNLVFQNGYIFNQAVDADLYEAFMDCYRKDLVLYNYSLVTSEQAVGCVDVTLLHDASSVITSTASYEIYPSYTNTIALLEEYGLYDPDCFTSEYVSMMDVTVYANDENYHYTIIDPDAIDALAPYLKSSYSTLYFPSTEDEQQDEVSWYVTISGERVNGAGEIESLYGDVEVSSELTFEKFLEIME